MKILVRLPNWLGDMVMATGFMRQLPEFFPGAEMSVIAKKGIDPLLDFFPNIHHRFVFDKVKYPGIRGQFHFGKQLRTTEFMQGKRFDLYFSLPDSMSTAITGYASSAKHRVGYKNEMRSLLLTHAFNKPMGLHRVETYVRLLELYGKRTASKIEVRLDHSFKKQDYVVLNINSEASSRRLTPEKAVDLLSALRQQSDDRILLIGAPKEQEFVTLVHDNFASNGGNVDNVQNWSGRTSLTQLIPLIGSAKRMVSTDSGPAHLANALGTAVTVLFGAGNELHTAPYNTEGRRIIRLGELSCEPCEKNICTRFNTPQCLERLDVQRIVSIEN